MPPIPKRPSWGDIAAVLRAAGAVALPRTSTSHERYRMPDGRVFPLSMQHRSRTAPPVVVRNLRKFLSEPTGTPLRTRVGA